MRPLRTYWHWFVGMGLLSVPMLVFPVVFFGLPKLVHTAVYQAATPVLAGVVPGLGLIWFGWVCPVIEFRYLRDWRPTIPRARQSMIFMLYVPAALFAFMVHFVIWISVLLERLVRQYQRFDMSPAKWLWMTATLALLGLTLVYHHWYREQYRVRCLENGLCVECGYDKRVNPKGPCPECGAGEDAAVRLPAT